MTVVRLAGPAEQAAVRALLIARGLPLDGLETAWRTWVAAAGDQVVGTASLECHDGAVLLRSVAVAEGAAGSGIGTRLVQTALHAADDAGLGPVALLTETAAAWFPRFGFQAVDRDRLPAALAASPELRGACPASATAMIHEGWGTQGRRE